MTIFCDSIYILSVTLVNSWGPFPPEEYFHFLDLGVHNKRWILLTLLTSKETEAQRDSEKWGSWLHSEETAELGPEFRFSDAMSSPDLVLPQVYLSVPTLRRPLRSSSTTYTLQIRKSRSCQLMWAKLNGQVSDCLFHCVLCLVSNGWFFLLVIFHLCPSLQWSCRGDHFHWFSAKC